MDGNYAVAITGHEQAELIEVDAPRSLNKNEIRSRTITSLISPGTELNACYNREKGFPIFPGYAAVCEIEEMGDEVEELSIGDKVYLAGNHRSVIIKEASYCTLIPESISPQIAVIARLMQISMTSLITTEARPGDSIIVSGFGPVGYLAAHMFLISGYNVTVVEPNAERRNLAINSGIEKAFEYMPLEKGALQEEISLVVECSGHEQALLDALKVVRRNSEVIMVGVPWKKQTDISGHEILWEVFHNYVKLRTGWEHELPVHSSNTAPHSLMKNINTALTWLNTNRIPLKETIRTHHPKDANEAYQGHLLHTEKELFSIFTWD
ncbi:MAG: dehydrogenase [Planctomycetota bacterium]|nr:MAG: dehydrogenase [Planctomycetota bacterium]